MNTLFRGIIKALQKEGINCELFLSLSHHSSPRKYVGIVADNDVQIKGQGHFFMGIWTDGKLSKETKLTIMVEQDRYNQQLLNATTLVPWPEAVQEQFQVPDPKLIPKLRRFALNEAIRIEQQKHTEQLIKNRTIVSPEIYDPPEWWCKNEDPPNHTTDHSWVPHDHDTPSPGRI